MVDVVICSHNRAGFLRETLSVLERQGEACRAIVVDDSDDQNETLGLLKASPICDRFAWFRPDGLYHRVAKFNFGVNMAVAENMVLLDDDCIPLGEDFIAGYLEAFKDAPIVRGRFLHEGKRTLPPWFSTANIGMSRSVFYAIGGFDARYDGRYGYDDVDIEKSIQRYKFPVAIGGDATCARHVGEPFSGDRVASQINEKLYREKWGL